MLKRIAVIIALQSLIVLDSPAQVSTSSQEVSTQDLLDALSFAGVNMFTFKIDCGRKNYSLYIYAEERDSARGVQRRDTLFEGRTLYSQSSQPATFSATFVDRIRIIGRTIPNDFSTIYFNVHTAQRSLSRSFQVQSQFADKHFWARFAERPTEASKIIPLLLFGWEQKKGIPRINESTKIVEGLDAETTDSIFKLASHCVIVSYELR